MQPISSNLADIQPTMFLFTNNVAQSMISRFLSAAIILATSLGAVCAESGPTPKQMSPAHRLIQSDRPLVIAHRGFSSRAPENTIAAFELAKRAEPDLIELDYYHSRDGEIVVFHDKTLDRTSDAIDRWGGEKLPISDYSLNQLRELDAGKWFGKQFEGERIPTLAESLDVIQHGNVTLIERKAGDAKKCVELVRSKGLVNEVVVQSFDWNFLRDYRRHEPTQAIAALGPRGTRNGRKLPDEEKRLGPQWIDEVVELGAEVVAWNREIDRAAVEYAHERGLKVWVYTINEEKLANELLQIGVDGIITDDPEMIRGVVGK